MANPPRTWPSNRAGFRIRPASCRLTYLRAGITLDLEPAEIEDKTVDGGPVDLVGGIVSLSGWADQICARCEKLRSQIETGAMSHFFISDRRSWRGPWTIGDDELVLAIQRRLRDADHRALETAEREKRHADLARRLAKYEEELEAAE